MDGQHDLGGKTGYGPVAVDDSLPGNSAGFAQRWHGVVFAILRALPGAGALQNSDQFRHAVERISSKAYLQHGYYGRWLGALENLLVEADVVTLAEIDARAGVGGSAAQPAQVPVQIDTPGSAQGSQRLTTSAALFNIGDWVVTSSVPKSGHTRLPAYARGKVGRVSAYHAGWQFPDTNAMGDGECPTHLYTVTFNGSALWGESAEPNCQVRLDLFEPYLEPAQDITHHE